MSKEAELGTLVVVILKARNLIDKHSFYKQDVFAQASLNGITKQTHVSAKGGQHPVWDAELRFPVMKAVSDKTRKLEVACFAKEPRGDDPLGKGSVDISETLKAGEFDDWVSLDIDGVVRGELFLEMTYFSSAPVVSNPSTAAYPTAGISQKSTRPPSERVPRPPEKVPSRPIPVSQSPSSAVAQRPFRPASHSPSKSNDATMPPLPEDQANQATLPGTLVPGGGTGPRPRRSPLGLEPLPSLLMPGNGNVPTPTSRPQDYTPRPSTSSLPSSLRPAGNPSPYTDIPTQNPYISGPTRASPTPSIVPPDILPTIPSEKYPSHASHHAPPSVPSTTEWGQYDTGATAASFSFPMPMVATPSFQPNLREDSAYHSYGYHQAMDRPPSPLSDPRLRARYQSPLPFPPGADPKPSTVLSGGRQPDPQSGSDRLEALRSAEEAVARRREQEQKDLELALQLDKELNT